jgi:hypothetical protein
VESDDAALGPVHVISALCTSSSSAFSASLRFV